MYYWTRIALPWRLSILALAWLLLVSSLHFWLNFEHSQARVVRMGYMPVITNLAAPLLDYASHNDPDLRFKGIKFASFAEMAEALRNSEIEAAFIIAPLAIVLGQQNAGVRIVYIGNRHESTLVVRKDLAVKRLADLRGKTVAVPMRYSGHNLSIRQLIEEQGLSGIRIVEMNPPDMASALAAGSLDAYYVGEPFAAQTLKNGDAQLLHYVEDVWPDFICNLVIVKQDWIEKEPALVARLVQGAARSGLWAKQELKQTVQIASQYWNQPEDLVEYALTTPKGRILYDHFTPKEAEIQKIADLMVHFGLLENNDIQGLVEDRFAKEANLQGITDLESILQFKNKD